MAIALVQSTTGTGALVLNGVAAGNTLICWQSIYRGSSTQAVVATPTDSNGTFTGGIGGVPAFLNGTASDIGFGIFYEGNAAAGTHTVTPEAADADHGTLAEFSGMHTAPFDVSNTAKTANTAITSQVTGTTGTTAQNDELIIIGLCLAAVAGSANVGFTNPVSGFTTLQITSDDLTDIAVFHSYKIVSATGTQAATFNWTDNEANQSAHAAIATFKASAAAAANAPNVNDSATLTESVTMKMDLKNTSSNDAVTTTESVTMKMDLKNMASSDTATVTESLIMHMPISLKMQKLT